MRGNAFACLLVLAVITVAVWFGCTDNPVRDSREAPVPLEGDDGAGLYDWAIAPIEGITTVWHPAPKQISVPVGTTIRFKCADPADADISWSNATLVKRTDGGSIAEVVVDKPGTFEIAVEAPESDTGGGTKGKPGGLTATILHSCVITGVNVAVRNIDVTASISASPLELTESSSNEETMLAFFGGGARFQKVSKLQEIDTDRYVSAVGRMLSLTASAEDARLTPLVELRVPGARPQLVGPVDVMFPASGTHVISVGPTANPKRVVIETYSVKITSHPTGQAMVVENQLTTFRASTTPPGYERFITWVSSTKYGVATPVLGRGATFQATFSKTWGPHPDIPNQDFQWLGVRADNTVFNQDQKPPVLSIDTVNPASGPAETVVTVTGNNFGNNPDNLCALLRNPVTHELVGCRVLTAVGTTATVEIGYPRAALHGMGMQFMMAKGPGGLFAITPPAGVTLCQNPWVWGRHPDLDGPGEVAVAALAWTPTAPVVAAASGSTPPACVAEFHSGPPAGGQLVVTLNADWGIGNQVVVNSRIYKSNAVGGDTRICSTFTASGTRLQCATKICNMLQNAYLSHATRPLNVNCNVAMVGPNAVITITCVDPGVTIVDGGVDICVK